MDKSGIFHANQTPMCQSISEIRVRFLSPPVNISLTVPRRCFFCGSFLLVMLHVDVCYAAVSVPCSLVVNG